MSSSTNKSSKHHLKERGGRNETTAIWWMLYLPRYKTMFHGSSLCWALNFLHNALARQKFVSNVYLWRWKTS
jgi:hypothetical protein